MSNILHIFHKIHNYGVVGDRTVTFQSSLSTPWQVGEWSHSLMVRFGILGLLKELIFLLGKRLRPRYWLKIHSSEGGIGGCLIDAMSKAEKETGDHVLLHCMEAHILWQLIFALFDEQWAMHTKVRRMLLSWGGCFVGKKKKEKGLEDCSFILFFWSIWSERNRRTFENCESLDQTIKSSF